MPTTATAPLRDLIAAEHASLTELRRDLHAHPELMFEERRTSEVIQRELTALGIAFKAGLGAHTQGDTGTGVVAHIPATDPNAPSASVGLRADIDALPITENTGAPHASTTPGVMHACGHDGHTAMLIGAARVLTKLGHRPNHVTLVFQPAEEGGAGGEKLVRDGALKGESALGPGLGPPVARMHGQHGWPQVPLGTVGTKPGPLLAATNDFKVTLTGVQAHGAMPHLGKDPVVAAAHIVTALQTIASRSTSPLDSVVCTVGAIHAGTADNVIPGSAEMIGTVRTLLPETRTLAEERFKEIVTNTARAHGCDAQIEWHYGYPVTSNDPALAAWFLAESTATFGEANTLLVPEPFMGGEDFAYYGLEVPACFSLLGLLPPGADPAAAPQLHQAEFDFNDDAIPAGVESLLMCALGTPNPS